MVAYPPTRKMKVIYLHKSKYKQGEQMKHSFSEVVDLFYTRVPEDYKKVPIEEYSDERMGGWIVRDTENMVIGWVGNRGDVTVYNYEDRPLKKYIE